MAIFSDQFDRFNPLRVEAYGPIGPIVNNMLMDARSYAGRQQTVQSCTEICRLIEHEFQQRIEPRLRLNFLVGEYALLQQDLQKDKGSLTSGLLATPYPWEVYACLALWKAIDVWDIFKGRPKLDEDKDVDLWDEANENLAVAYKALQICASLVGSRIADFKSRNAEAEIKSERGRDNIAPRWEARNEHMTFALSRVPGIRTKFRIDCARRLSKLVKAEFGVWYQPETIDQWLKGNGWSSPNILRGA